MKITQAQQKALDAFCWIIDNSLDCRPLKIRFDRQEADPNLLDFVFSTE